MGKVPGLWVFTSYQTPQNSPLTYKSKIGRFKNLDIRLFEDSFGPSESTVFDQKSFIINVLSLLKNCFVKEVLKNIYSLKVGRTRF